MFKSTKKAGFFLIGILFSAYIVGRLAHDIFTQNGPVQQVATLAAEIPPGLQEAFDQFEQKAIFYDPKIPVNVADTVTFGRYLRSMDPFAEFLEPAEYKALVASQKDNYTGVGMEIEKNETGQIVCFPYSNSPASLGGVENGDILEAVEGRKVGDLTLYKVALLLWKKKGGGVKISIVKKKGRRKDLILKRQYITRNSVTVKFENGLPVIRIHAFSRATTRELKLALKGLKGDSAIVLDVRDNPGGDFHKAIDSAMLLLERDKKIVTIKSRHADKVYASTTAALHPASLIYIWQNQNTASAAEVFSAALTANLRAESIGKTSYGKGTVQDVIELSDGAAIIFTSGYLLPLGNEIFHRKGLAPTHSLTADRLTTNDYIRITKELVLLKSPMGHQRR